MERGDEITIEITDFCEEDCDYCSSDSISDKEKANFIEIDDIKEILENKRFDHIILSGGEPLSHPDFYEIKKLCEKHSDDVIIQSNAIKHLIYNPNVIDGVYLEANLTVLPETDKVRLLRRVKQGRESDRPEVNVSRNFSENCSCDHKVVKPNAEIYGTPCSKNANEESSYLEDR